MAEHSPLPWRQEQPPYDFEVSDANGKSLAEFSQDTPGDAALCVAAVNSYAEQAALVASLRAEVERREAQLSELRRDAYCTGWVPGNCTLAEWLQRQAARHEERRAELREARELAAALAVELGTLRRSLVVRQGCHPSYLEWLDKLLATAEVAAVKSNGQPRRDGDPATRPAGTFDRPPHGMHEHGPVGSGAAVVERYQREGRLPASDPAPGRPDAAAIAAAKPVEPPGGVECPNCEGHGAVDLGDRELICPMCVGMGRIEHDIHDTRQDPPAPDAPPAHDALDMATGQGRR